MADSPALAEVTWISGIPGVGKSNLLREIAATCQADGIKVQRLDCRSIEPTEAGFEQALRQAGEVQIVCLDHYDHCGLLDAFLRLRWLPQQQNVRLLIAARAAPTPQWLQAGFEVCTIPLDLWDQQRARTFLNAAGVKGEAVDQVWRITRGHPLALELAVNSRGVAKQNWQSQSPAEVIAQLAKLFLENVEDDATRLALQAAATVRRITEPMLRAMLKLDEGTLNSAPSHPSTGAEIMERLAAMPLVETCDDGLALHPTVHQALADWLRTTDPIRFIKYRRRAWRALEIYRSETRAQNRWSHTADVIFLIDDPLIREAYFPSVERQYGIEPFRQTDRGALLEMIQKHDGDAERERMNQWLDQVPTAFWVARDAQNQVRGFYCLVDPAAAPIELLQQDPVTSAWLAGNRAAGRKGIAAGHPAKNGNTSVKPNQELFLRRWLGDQTGDAPSPVQAACWLNIQRAYLKGRPTLRRVYLAVSDLAPYAATNQKLGFVPLDPPSNCPFQTALLDFGPGSVDGWLEGLARTSLGLQDSVTLDAHT
jgi:hypothetical protein